MIRVLLLFLLLPSTLCAATVNLTVNGSSGPVSVSTGSTVNFDLLVDCGPTNSTDLVYIPGTAQPKGGKSKSEVEWAFRNDTTSTIRINSFGVSWSCLNDPGNDCSTWKFDYVKFENNQPVKGPEKIFEGMAPASPFPLTVFDVNVGSGAYANPWIDITAGQTIQVDEMEFVDAGGDKIDSVPSGTSVQFVVTFGDTSGNTYTQTFTVTW